MPGPSQGSAPSRPLVSVIMPVWNGDAFLREAIASVLSQTYTNIELIVVDDASTDGTEAILSEVRDRRVHVLRNPTNLGIGHSLLRAIDRSRGEYLARIDSDDLCLRSRIARQVRFMEKNPNVDVLGGGAVLFGRPPTRMKWVARRDRDIRAELFFRCALIHPSVMFRSATSGEWYDPQLRAAEDYELWVRLASRGAVFANLKAPVIRYRLHSKRASEVRAALQAYESGGAQMQFVALLLDDISDFDRVAMRALSDHRRVSSEVLSGAIDLGQRLVAANEVRRFVEPKAFRRRTAFEVASLMFWNLREMVHLEVATRRFALGLVVANPVPCMRAGWRVLLRSIARRRRTMGSTDDGH